jgi:hypothetical protein
MDKEEEEKEEEEEEEGPLQYLNFFICHLDVYYK